MNKKTPHYIIDGGLGLVGLSFNYYSKNDGKTCTTNWVFKIRFVMFTSNHVVVCCLTILPSHIRWDKMKCESETIRYNRGLRN